MEFSSEPIVGTIANYFCTNSSMLRNANEVAASSDISANICATAEPARISVLDHLKMKHGEWLAKSALRINGKLEKAAEYYRRDRDPNRR